MVITVVGMLLASLQAADVFSLILTIEGGPGAFVILGLEEVNGLGMAVIFSAWGGLYTFVTRFISARKMLLDSVPES